MQAIGQSIWPAIPGTPTIGTATVASSTSATVAFTAGSTGYPTTVTFTATSSPGGLTGTGASSPVTVTGLTTGTAYTFTVTATNATGTSAASAASNSITPVMQVGDAYAGGFYAGQISTAGNSIADYNLVVGPISSAENSSKQWKTSNTTTAGTSSVIDGPANSTAMNDASHPAAQFCEAVTVGGFSDWYMPAQNELEVCYYNLKPTTTANNTSYGLNPNAVPSRASTYYTSGTPPRTSSVTFQSGGAQAFASIAPYYWNSTETSSTRGGMQFFNVGRQGNYLKTYSYSVRAIRRVAV